MPRTMLTDDRWDKLLLLLRHTGRIYNKTEHRKTFEGILYRMRAGCPWRDVPDFFGAWSAIYRRFNLWSKKGIIIELFKLLSTESDMEWQFIDGSIVKAHQHSTGAASKKHEGIGKSVAGNTTKIHMAVDSYGLPIVFDITGGEVHDSKAAPFLIKQLPRADYIVADKGYDSELIREQVRARKAIPVIPRKRNSKKGNADIDWCLYKYRHLVENVFARLKHYRGIATRYDKLQRNYASTLALGCCLMWLPMNV
ncbi:IS5 family transposase [Pseudocolwellia sp. HL-MZ19]|uniref:IS5 family transposase n=1 Tax=Pseudocolwellia sp. HL-MZ19 TaxID=3400846 RepID=UPI003CE79671